MQNYLLSNNYKGLRLNLTILTTMKLETPYITITMVLEASYTSNIYT